jgi:hypothetical protein
LNLINERRNASLTGVQKIAENERFLIILKGISFCLSGSLCESGFDARCKNFWQRQKEVEGRKRGCFCFYASLAATALLILLLAV